MTKELVVNMNKTKEYDVRIDRASKWGNPFTVDTFGRDDCIERYKEALAKNKLLLNDLPSLQGLVMGCHCKPKACHGDHLNRLVNFGEKQLKIMVSGSRTITDYQQVKDALDSALVNREKYDDIIIIHGDARGVDKLAGRYASENGIYELAIPALWDLYGKSAGMKRNTVMAKLANAFIAIWDGESKGTKDAMDLSLKMENIKARKLVAYF